MSKFTTPNPNDIFKPGQPLPSDAVMIATALDILNQIPHGQRLVDFVKDNDIDIRIMATPQPTTYLPETTRPYIGFNRNNPVTPSRFVLMLSGILREAQQEHAGIKHPHLHASIDEHMKVSMAKEEDKVWYMCTVAFELNDLDIFTEYNFVDELRNMGYSASVELYIKQENKS